MSEYKRERQEAWDRVFALATQKGTLSEYEAGLFQRPDLDQLCRDQEDNLGELADLFMTDALAHNRFMLGIGGITNALKAAFILGHYFGEMRLANDDEDDDE